MKKRDIFISHAGEHSYAGDMAKKLESPIQVKVNMYVYSYRDLKLDVKLN